MKKSILSLLLACFLQINLAFAQNVMKGVVSDANGPLVGVVIHDKDNAKGTTSDMSGKYALNGAESGHTIEFRYLGYVTETVVWDGKSVVNIKLKEDAVQLEETVVIGYGSVKKKDLTGAVGVINSSLIEKQSTSQLSQSLQGLIPGLTVTRSSSMPGASATVQVRGVTTMSDSSPLILVDGMMVSSLDNIASEDVQQITVLKDAASASIYGARAAAGVILITTKEATEGQLSIGYNGEISLSSPTEFPKFLTDPYHYMTMYNEWSWNDAGNPAGGEFANYSQDYIDNYATNNRYDPIQYPIYDWKDAILSNTAMRHKHNLTMTYGNKVIKSHTSATYENADAIYKGSNHERISIRSRNNLKISDKLSGSIDFSVRYATKNDPTSGSPIRAAYMYPSIYLGLYPDGRVGPGKDGSLSNTLAALLEGGEKKTVSNTMTGKFSLSYKPIKDLTLTANLTPTVGTVSIKEMKKAIPVYDAYETDVMLGYVSGYTSNSLSEERRNIKSLEKQFIATYDKTFSKVHNFNAMVGYEDYSYTYETMSGSTNDMSLSSFPYLDLANKNALAVAGNSYQNAYRSFFGRVMYNYDSRYYLQLNAREDGSSRFHKDHRWGFFPSASVGWVISNEKFMQNITPINYLKFRASIGTLGNERIGNYPYQTYISFNNAIMYDSAGSTPQSSMSAAQQDYAYENIHWEKTQSWDIGVDAAFFNNRLDFSADYYYKKTTDMLLSVAIPSFTGYSAPDRNVGKMHTRGWEVKLGWSDRIGDVSYAVSFNISDYKSMSYTYKNISRANRILEALDKLEGKYSTTELNTLRAEARFFRAFAYSRLITLWGDVPFYVTSITPEEAFEMGRTDKAVVLKQIYDDYDYAAENLPVANNNSGATRVDKGTAYAYKARTALYQHDYGTAAKAAQDCMDLEVYDLAPDYGELFRDKTRGSKEVIFSVAHSSDLELDENGKPTTQAIGSFIARSAGGTHNAQPSWELLAVYEMTNGKTIDEPGSGFDPHDPFANRDPRCLETFAAPGSRIYGIEWNPAPNALEIMDYTQNRMITNKDSKGGSDASNCAYNGCCLRKGAQESWRTTLYNDNPVILMRYADVLLMYAEAKIELGEIDATVLACINDVRARAYGTTRTQTNDYPSITTTDQTALRKVLRRERRVEFAWENLRYFDLLRWHQFENAFGHNMYGFTRTANRAKEYFAAGNWFWPETPTFDKDGFPSFEAMADGTYIVQHGERKYDEKIYLWPLPSDDVLIMNGKLVQNPGY